MIEKKPEVVFEVSWEVLNKVGGIHTVVRSKADYTARQYDEYYLVGPFFRGRSNLEFEEESPPPHMQDVFTALKELNIDCMFGTWKIKGEPKVILVDATSSSINADHVKGLLWEKYQIDSIHAGYDFTEPLQWSWAVGLLIEKYYDITQKQIVGHFHEWLSGFAQLYLHHKQKAVGTVFTTHATMLGRSICGSTDIDLYGSLAQIDPYASAKKLDILDKFTTEVACAKTASVFTTVSEITGLEAEHFLGRKLDILLFNGIDANAFPTIEESSLLHRRARERLRDFLNFTFFSHYSFDLDNTLIFFIGGRYEYRNKGMDILTAALEKLNNALREEQSDRTIVVLYFIPGDAQGVKVELLEERATFAHMKQFIHDHAQEITRKILRNADKMDDLRCDQMLSDEATRKIKQMYQNLRHTGNPPHVTHSVRGENDSDIVRGFKQHNLTNGENDPVKVLWLPIYLNGTDGLLDLTYREAIAGSHLGIFPSYYEPWGYTPVEAAALSVPAVTTDLAGFGRYIKKMNRENKGIFVLERFEKSWEYAVQQLFEHMHAFCKLDKFGRNEQKVAAKHLSNSTQWNSFIKKYFQAHMQANGLHH